MKIKLLYYPNQADWIEVKRRALITVDKTQFREPDAEWKHNILKANHSPIRYLRFSFLITDLPYFVSTHLARHVHAQPYIASQRNDRQSKYDRNEARQDAPVKMIWDLNGEAIKEIISKRLCGCASAETQEVAEEIRRIVYEVCPEYVGLIERPCVLTGHCNEMYPCVRKGV